MDRYPATYFDAKGTESTSIENDSELLRMSVRGVEFVGSEFDSLEPTMETTPSELSGFSFDHGFLSSCRIQCRMPIRINAHDRDGEGILEVDIALGKFDHGSLRIALEHGGQRFAGPGNTGWFEDELNGLQKQLPSGWLVKACINCLYSDYSPAGHGLFGSMMCFRNRKQDYLAVRSKHQMWSLKCDRLVQETYLCPEFERRVPGTGYRG
jgi:hypothetical protein